MSLFGGNANSGAGLFGASTNNNSTTQPSNIFGSFGGGGAAVNNSNANGQQQQQTASPFGTLGGTQSSVFGGGNASQTQTTGAFGQATQPQTGLFGQSLNIQAQNTGAFGQSTQTQNTSAFGQSARPQLGLFGQPAQSTSAFGQSNPSTFGQPAQPQSGSFGQTMNNQVQNFGGSGFGGLQQQQQQQQQQQSMMQSRLGGSLWQPGNSMNPREKSIPEQMQMVLEKWSPESGSCQFQHYFYNRVQAETVPYYGPAPGEEESKWEEALAKKPDDGAIPVLCRGFSALGNRLRVQVQSVTLLQQRLHEINNSLAAMLQNHDLEISVRTVDAKRRHVALSQRSLQLATKVQLLRNRGYAMDSAEEELRQKLTELERGAFDPLLSGRQEEIWARMVGIRARARILQEEMEKSGVSDAHASRDDIDEEVLRKVKKILSDYDSQISHLQRELEDICKEYSVWESSRPAQPVAA